MDRDSSLEGRRLPPSFRFRILPQGLARSTIEHLHISPTRNHPRSSSPDSHTPHSFARSSRPWQRLSPRRPSTSRRPSTEDEADAIRQFREFDARYGEANRTNVVRARRRNEQANFQDYEDWNIAGLFGLPSDGEQVEGAVGYHNARSRRHVGSPNNGEQVEGAVGYHNARSRRYVDDSEDEAERHQALVEYHTRTYIGRSLINSKLETKKLILLAVLRLKVRSPNLTSESAWQQTVEWL